MDQVEADLRVQRARYDQLNRQHEELSRNTCATSQITKDKIMDQETTIKALERELTCRIVQAEHRPQVINPFGVSPYLPGRYTSLTPGVHASSASATVTRDGILPSPIDPIVIDDAQDDELGDDAPMPQHDDDQPEAP